MPGFGAFVSNYSSAKVNPTEHTFTPPSKQIVFNKHLRQNDGLLAQTIVNENGCSFDEAMNAIRYFSEDLARRIKNNERVELHHLGMISGDVEGNISFEATTEVNYFIGSFGLTSFRSLPVITDVIPDRRKPIERIDRVVPEEKKTITEKAIATRPRRTRAALVTVAILLPLLIAGLWFTSVKTNALAGFSWFGNKKYSLYNPEKISRNLPGKDEGDLVPDANGIAHINLADNAPDIIVDIHKVVPDSTMVAKMNDLHLKNSSSWGEKKYYVIAGAFAVPENVTKYLRVLEKKGFKPEIVERLSSKLTHIGIASFDSKTEAEQFLSTVNKDLPGVWILKK